MKATCYHGTDKKYAQQIIDNGFIISDNDKGWLGKGVYFFEMSALTEGYREAYNFAYHIRHFSEPKVIIAAIECLDEEKVIDVFKNVEDRELFDLCKETAYNLHVKSRTTEKFSDMIIFRLIDANYKPKVVRALIDSYREKRYTSFVVRRPELVICVKDTSCIKDRVLPRE